VDPEFWHERWERGEIGFHQKDFNAHMQNHMGLLRLDNRANVLVPLCGKSRDMLWLASQGFRVTGVEINARAVDAFFAENALEFEAESCADGQRFLSEQIEIWCADFFQLDAASLPKIDAVYDRASLVALPRRMRKVYANRLGALISPGTPMLLVTLDYPPLEMNGPPFPVSSFEVFDLFEGNFQIEEVLTEDCLEREQRFKEKGVTQMSECVHVLRRL
jgi:thiopurine S-methyltransferase